MTFQFNFEPCIFNLKFFWFKKDNKKKSYMWLSWKFFFFKFRYINFKTLKNFAICFILTPISYYYIKDFFLDSWIFGIWIIYKKNNIEICQQKLNNYQYHIRLTVVMHHLQVLLTWVSRNFLCLFTKKRVILSREVKYLILLAIIKKIVEIYFFQYSWKCLEFFFFFKAFQINLRFVY